MTLNTNVKEEVTPFHISFSEHRLFEGCSFKHYLQKRLNFQEPKGEALVFGSVIHGMIEKIAVKTDKNITELYNQMLKEQKEQNSIDPKFKPTLTLKTQANKIIRQLQFDDRFKDYEVVDVEYKLYEPLVEDSTGEIIYIKGFIDMVFRHKTTGRILIVDWKTANKPWDISKKTEDRGFFGQLVLYKHFYSRKFNISENNIDTWFVVLSRFGTPVVQEYNIDITPKFTEEILSSIKENAIKIKNTTLETVKKAKFHDKNQCKYCFFKNTVCNDEEKQLEIPQENKKE